jgi:hypothetical protein
MGPHRRLTEHGVEKGAGMCGLQLRDRIANGPVEFICRCLKSPHRIVDIMEKVDVLPHASQHDYPLRHKPRTP